MKTNKLMLCVFGFMLLFAVSAASAADAPKLTFKFTTLKVPGAVQTFPSAVSNSGVIVGAYLDSSGASHGFMLKGKKVTPINDPNGTNTSCQGINLGSGATAIAGYYINSSGNSVGFLYTPKNGKFKDIPGPAGATASAADSLNDKGEIIGYYVDSTGVTHGFYLAGGQYYYPLDVPGATATYPYGINNKGNIAFAWVDSNGAYESSLLPNYKSSKYKTINVPGATQSVAQNLNNAGDVPYAWIDSSNVEHGALLISGKYYKFDRPNSIYTQANGITDRHLIVGSNIPTNGSDWEGYKATYK
jgi:uncharacterized membrane protein